MNMTSILSPLKIESILIACLCGFIIGIERQISGKPVGIRTCCLICLGTYTFVISSQIFQGVNTDPTRIIGQIVTGIGFIGAGVILTREGLVVGVTSAAVIWILAGIGILISLDKFTASIFLSVLVVIILRGVNFLEKLFMVLTKGIYSKISSRRKSLKKPTIE